MAEIRLDVTSAQDIAAAAPTCADVNLLVNIAGRMLTDTMLAQDSEVTLRQEMEVSVSYSLAAELQETVGRGDREGV